MHTETKQEKGKGARAWHVLMMSQRTNEVGMGTYKRGFPGKHEKGAIGHNINRFITEVEINHESIIGNAICLYAIPILLELSTMWFVLTLAMHFACLTKKFFPRCHASFQMKLSHQKNSSTLTLGQFSFGGTDNNRSCTLKKCLND